MQDAKPHLELPPDAQLVERVGLTMAAALGLVWQQLDWEVRSRFRLQANAAMMRLAVEMLVQAPTHLHQVAVDAAASLRTAASLADFNKERETTIQRLTRDASNMEILAGLLAPTEPEEAI